MIENEQQPKEVLTFEKVRSYFIDPKDPDIARLALLGADSLRAMAQIYASGGDPMEMTADIRGWLFPDQEFFQDNGNDVRRVIGELLQHESSTRRFDQRFMGQIHPQGSEIGIVGHMIAAYVNTNTVVHEVSTSENMMEGEVLRWVGNMFGYNTREFSGNIVSGGTTANLTALWAAREKKIVELQAKGKWHRGMPLYVIGTEMAHYSVKKSCELLGHDIIFLNAPTQNFKTDASALEKMIEQITSHGREIMAIIGIAGETETGMVDNFNDLADIAEKYHIYLHADAAYGGPFILSKAGHLFQGIERADSITVDPHKMLYVPYPAGIILFKDKHVHLLIEKGQKALARYLLTNEERSKSLDEEKIHNYGFSRPEGSMSSAGAISTWATMKLFGDEGIRLLLDHTIELTNAAYERLEELSLLRPLYKPETNSLLIGLRNYNFLSKEVQRIAMKNARDRLDSRGFYISLNEDVDGEKNDKRPAYRFVAMHPYTTKKDVYDLLDILEKELSYQLDT